MANGLTMQQIQVGDVSTFTKTVTESDITLFAGFSGDFNQIGRAHV